MNNSSFLKRWLKSNGIPNTTKVVSCNRSMMIMLFGDLPLLMTSTKYCDSMNKFERLPREWVAGHNSDFHRLLELWSLDIWSSWSKINFLTFQSRSHLKSWSVQYILSFVICFKELLPKLLEWKKIDAQRIKVNIKHPKDKSHRSVPNPAIS